MKTNLSPSIKFLIAIFVQLAIVFGLVVFNAAMLARGTEILLPIEPFDPRDPLRGDYAILRYEISNIKEDFFVNKGNELKGNDLIYVSLEKRDNYWIAKGASVQKPKEGLFIGGMPVIIILGLLEFPLNMVLKNTLFPKEPAPHWRKKCARNKLLPRWWWTKMVKQY